MCERGLRFTFVCSPGLSFSQSQTGDHFDGTKLHYSIPLFFYGDPGSRSLRDKLCSPRNFASGIGVAVVHRDNSWTLGHWFVVFLHIPKSSRLSAMGFCAAYTDKKLSVLPAAKYVQYGWNARQLTGPIRCPMKPSWYRM